MVRRPEVAVGAVAVKDGSLLMIRRGSPPSEGRWSVPGGRVEWAEDMAAALRREVAEETGLDVVVGELAGVVERIYPDQGFHYVILDYYVTVTGGTLRAGGDVTDARWVEFPGVPDLPLAEGLLGSLRDFGVLV